MQFVVGLPLDSAQHPVTCGESLRSYDLNRGSNEEREAEYKKGENLEIEKGNDSSLKAGLIRKEQEKLPPSQIVTREV